ncbi:hypothetical protein MBLNU457_5176t1 [Dothideomycetes sp. NU457]
METLSKIAGVQDASQHMQPGTSRNEQHSVPLSDLEAQNQQQLTRRASRSSLPLDRRPSRKSLHSTNSVAQINEDVPPVPGMPQYTASRTSHDDGHSATGTADEDEMAWGPSHPCFPHPNPHVSPTSALYKSTRVIRVQRDWLVAGDLYPALQNMYPEILAEWISEREFRELIETINGMLEKAFSPLTTRAVVDGWLSVLTGSLWDDAGFAGSKAGVKRLEKWMDAWNKRKREENNEVRLVPLRRTGFLNLDIQIPDPEIDVPFEDGPGLAVPEAAHL